MALDGGSRAFLYSGSVTLYSLAISEVLYGTWHSEAIDVYTVAHDDFPDFAVDLEDGDTAVFFLFLDKENGFWWPLGRGVYEVSDLSDGAVLERLVEFDYYNRVGQLQRLRRDTQYTIKELREYLR